MNQYQVTAYYDMTQLTATVYGISEENAEQDAVELFTEQFGDTARQYEHIHTRQQ